MAPRVQTRVVAQKSAFIDAMLAGLDTLPLDNEEAFLSAARDVAAAESFLRRSLEALLDLGSLVLSEGFGVGPREDADLAPALELDGILLHGDALLLAKLTAHRARLADYFDELSAAEIFALGAPCREGVARVRDAMLDWLRRHPELVDGEL
jgi:uncharacterized protein YutE (UPF0331/DUF86 family)